MAEAGKVALESLAKAFASEWLGNLKPPYDRRALEALVNLMQQAMVRGAQDAIEVGWAAAKSELEEQTKAVMDNREAVAVDFRQP